MSPGDFVNASVSVSGCAAQECVSERVGTGDVWAHGSQPMFRNETEATLEFCWVSQVESEGSLAVLQGSQPAKQHFRSA